MGRASKETLRLYREIYHDVQTLTESEKIAMGLIKKPVVKGTIHIVVPEHYGAKGVWWESRWVTPAELEVYKARVPDLQIIE